MNRNSLILTLVIGLLGGILGAYLFAPQNSQQTKETAYERVMRTGTLRCAYFDWPPYVTKDPNSGKMSGIWYDYTEKLAEMLGWKVTWQVVGLGEISTALNQGTIDAHCGGLWITSERMKVVGFTRPISYQPLLVYVRGNETRFGDDLSKLNTPQVTFSVIDGEGAASLIPQRFPRAKLLSLPQISSKAEMFGQVVYGKADALIMNPASMPDFHKNNPGKLRAFSQQPVSVFAEALAVGLNELQLNQVLDHATEAMLNSGEIDQIIAKYESAPGEFWRTAPMYRAGVK